MILHSPLPLRQEELKRDKVEVSVLKESYTLNELVDAGYTPSELKQGGYTIGDMKDKLIPSQIRESGYTNSEMREQVHRNNQEWEVRIQSVLPCLLRAMTTSWAVHVFLLANSV